MAGLHYDPEKKLYTAAAELGELSHGGELTFRGSQNTSLAQLRLDSPDGALIAVCALSNGAGENTARFETAPVSGTHTVYISVDGRAELRELKFTPESPFERSGYEPVPESGIVDVGADSWEAVDMLGRKLPSAGDVGARNGRRVGIFYWTWREHAVGLRPVNVSRLLEKYPAAEYNSEHPGWGADKNFQPHWGEPLYGYYRNSDPYVIRRHAALLADAGVDFLLLDCTNVALLWRDAYEPLFAGLREARRDGINVPKVAFMLNFGATVDSAKMLCALYQDIYRPGRYSDLWFRLDGKPMVMAYPESLDMLEPEVGEAVSARDIREFFAFRPGQPLYGRENGGPRRPDHWGWLEIFPQHKFGERPDGSCEQMTVGVGQNANDELICTHFNNRATYGRSYTHRDGHALKSPESYKYGYNVQEQWERALDVKPDIVFVTGWNEWMMGLFHEPWVKDKDSTQLAMVDQYDREHSRDIEPDRDGYLDTYYLQLAGNVRRFKGAKPAERASAPKTVNIAAGVRQWSDVRPAYRANKGLLARRDWPGFAGCHYKNDTGRNDIIGAKVARDAEFVYFLAECSEEVSAPADEGWMTVYADTDRDKSTGWEGYDLRINGLCPKRGRGTVEAYVPGAEKNSFTWKKLGECRVRASGRFVQYAVPRAFFGGGRLCFEFKLSDNLQAKTALDFYENGCAAPIGRFNYLYEE